MNELCIIAAVVSVCASALSILFYINMTRMLRKHAIATKADAQAMVEQWMRILNMQHQAFPDRPDLPVN